MSLYLTSSLPSPYGGRHRPLFDDISFEGSGKILEFGVGGRTKGQWKAFNETLADLKTNAMKKEKAVQCHKEAIIHMLE